jgi:predicted dehydrogenase
MGANHARVLADLDGVELVAVADADQSRCAKATAGRPTPAFADAATLLREAAPQMVSVVVPTQLHEEVALAVIASGAHLLVEKPLAANVSSAHTIAAAAAVAGVILTVGHIERFNPAIQELKARLDAGQGGNVLQLRARRVGPFPHRIRDVGVIHDLAPHDIDIMRFLLGQEVETVYGDARRHITTEFEELFSGMLRFSGGAMGVLEINWLTPTKRRELEVLCERGMFVVDYAAQSLSFYENYAATAREGAIASVTEGPMTRYPIPSREPLRVELEAFRDAILHRGPPPVEAKAGIAALSVVEAFVRSAETGAPVTLDSLEVVR